MKEVSENYMKGLNQGYLIAKYLPDLFASLLEAAEKWGDYGNGFSEGGLLYDREQKVEILDELDQIREQSENKDLEASR